MYICPFCGNKEFEIDYPLTLTFNENGTITAIENLNCLINRNIKGIFPTISDNFVICKNCKGRLFIEELDEAVE